jgi:RimJ/RimL family protein N-acetyltransferase
MTDPSDALPSFQQALNEGVMTVRRGVIESDLYLHVDQPTETPRFIYVWLDDRTIAALVIAAAVSPIDGTPCFQLGYAVPEAYRGQGRAKRAVEAAIAEMKHGFGRANIRSFYVEAIVGVDNVASQHVAAKTLSMSPESVTDEISGLAALRYVRKVGDD